MDLESLRAVSGIQDTILGAWLTSSWPGVSGIVLEGLELQGAWAPVGSPGARRPDGEASEAVVSPGSALITTKGGRRLVIRVPEETRVRWPSRAGAAVRGVLVLVPQVEDVGRDGVRVARKSVRGVVGFLRSDLAEDPAVLPLASAVGNGRDWNTDLRRVWQPEHPAVQALLARLDRVGRTVWQAEPEGSVWERQVLGRNWVRYQTVATSAVQAARMVLIARPLTTADRVRVLSGLCQQLLSSVELAGVELLQSIGPAEGAGPYRAVVLGGHQT